MFVSASYRIKYPSPFHVIEKSAKCFSYVYFNAINKKKKKKLNEAESKATALWHSISGPPTGCDRAINQTSWVPLYPQLWIHLILHSQSPPVSR